MHINTVQTNPLSSCRLIRPEKYFTRQTLPQHINTKQGNNETKIFTVHIHYQH